MSDTPRTDLAVSLPETSEETSYERLFSLSRTLERELAEARKDSERLLWALDHPSRFARTVDLKYGPDPVANRKMWGEAIDIARST